ncbi:MAG: hypothetical protein LBF24_01220 [Puniceicoccales bacterium]|jgi:lipid-A-disaccharide synthase|nr:hypothetical protein [Puniceicoccales bacterium]
MGKVRLANAEKDSVDLLVIAAECSGDELGAELIRDYRRLRPSALVYGIGGPNMAREASRFLYNLVDHATMGIWEVLGQLPFFLRFQRKIIRWIAAVRPRRVCLIDSPALNLRIAKELFHRALSRKGGGTVSLYYYVAPQVWAWKAERRFALARYVDSLAVLFPFERSAFADTGLPVVYVGHPFLRSDSHPIHYAEDGALLLLPGSRQASIRRIFPIMLACAAAPALGQLPAVVCIYPTEDIRKLLVDQIIAMGESLTARVRLVSIEDAKKNSVGARLVLVSAGSMSLRCALAAIPGAIVYRTHPLTYWIGRQFLHIPRIGIGSILLGYECYPEFLQNDAQPSPIVAKLVQSLRGGDDFAVLAEELRASMACHGPLPAEWLAGL